MRFDSVGLWWEDHPVAKTKAERLLLPVRMAPVPETGWKPPKEFPNLSGARVIGLDTETKDQELREKGPGCIRGTAHTVGVSIATQDAAWYFPMRHEYDQEKEFNFSPDHVHNWLRDTLKNGVMVVGANLKYDLEILQHEGLPYPSGEIFDVQLAEPLIDENSGYYSLDAISQKYLGEGKATSQLYEWCAKSFGGQANGKQRENIWRSPPSLVGPYAEQDARAPFEILAKQRKILAEEGLTDLFRMECALTPMLIAMRRRGVCIDQEKLEKTVTWLRSKRDEAQILIPDIDVWANESIARAFDKQGHSYPMTEAGNPSFTKLFLESQTYPLAKAILDVRLYEKAINPFIESYLLGNMHNGRVHCQFNQLRSDDGGAVSGRFSSSDPNLQNIPARHLVIGPMLRGLFIPEPGKRWRRQDYSQVEYRLLAHYAIGGRAEELRQQYITNPKVNFHKGTAAMVEEYTQIVMEYKASKNLNFGLVYGMGEDKLARTLGVSLDLAERLLTAYFTALPCIKQTYNSASRLAKRKGYVRTILGRRRRFREGENAHAALNGVLQGGAADIIKKAMVMMWQEGLCHPDRLGAPHLTVHDELDWSDANTPESVRDFARVEQIMVECVKLRVPLMVDVNTGAHWGECK